MLTFELGCNVGMPLNQPTDILSSRLTLGRDIVPAGTGGVVFRMVGDFDPVQELFFDFDRGAAFRRGKERVEEGLKRGDRVYSGLGCWCGYGEFLRWHGSFRGFTCLA